MDQYYWLSTALEPDSDARLLVYRYGRFVYGGAVITEPVQGLEYLPAILQGVQGVQGQIPFVAEVDKLAAGSMHSKVLGTLNSVLDAIHEEVTAAEPKLAELAAAGASWLDDDDAAVYFEFEARPEHTCNEADVVFAKTYRGPVLMTVIWYGPSGSYFVSLHSAETESQALVDTLFPSIYGRRRGMNVCSYDAPPAAAAGAGAASSAKEGKEGEDAAGRGKWSRYFRSLSVWEASDPVPDPELVKERDEIAAAIQLALAAVAGMALDMAALEATVSAAADQEEERVAGRLRLEEEDAAIALAEALMAAADISGADEDGDGSGSPPGALSLPYDPSVTVDISGGMGYTQVYLVMQPSRASLAAYSDTGLVGRPGLFRFGDWIYAGKVAFPVEHLRLADVPYVLPALQKQQGALGYLCEAKNMPLQHPLTPTLRAFTAALSMLKEEIEDSTEDLAAAAEKGVNAWIDADWAASFYELSLQSGEGVLPEGLQQAEMIACKVYLTTGSGGLILHAVYFQGSMYCVLADNGEDLPLLDVAFPDVTARNRAVQLRTYGTAQASDMAARHSAVVSGGLSPAAAAAAAGAGGGIDGKLDSGLICPLPKALRVWEGRRRGIAGVGYGAPNALADALAGGGDGVEALRAKARARAEAEAAAAAAAAAKQPAPKKVAPAPESKADGPMRTVPAAAPAATDSKKAEGKEGEEEEEEDDLYALPSSAKTTLASPVKKAAAGAGAAADAAAAEGGAGALPSAAAEAALRGAALPGALFHNVARARHHLAPLQLPGVQESSADSRLAGWDGTAAKWSKPGGGAAAESKLDEALKAAPWDASGKPLRKL